jgi:hypothetical protein
VRNIAPYPLKNYFTGGEDFKPGPAFWVCAKKLKYDSIGTLEGILLSAKKEA